MQIHVYRSIPFNYKLREFGCTRGGVDAYEGQSEPNTARDDPLSNVQVNNLI